MCTVIFIYVHTHPSTAHTQHKFTHMLTNVLYTHNLHNSMNEQIHFFIKIYLSRFILKRVDVSVVCERLVERHTLRERTSSSHIFFQEPGGCQHLHLLASLSAMPLISCLSLTWLRFTALCLNLIAWFSLHDLFLVTHLLYLNALMCCHPSLLITVWQSVKAHRVTRKEPKIHVI